MDWNSHPRFPVLSSLTKRGSASNRSWPAEELVSENQMRNRTRLTGFAGSCTTAISCCQMEEAHSPRMAVESHTVTTINVKSFRKLRPFSFSKTPYGFAQKRPGGSSQKILWRHRKMWLKKITELAMDPMVKRTGPWDSSSSLAEAITMSHWIQVSRTPRVLS